MKKGLFTFLLTCILAVMSLSAQVENPGHMDFFPDGFRERGIRADNESNFRTGMESVFHVYAGRRTFGHYFDVE